MDNTQTLEQYRLTMFARLQAAIGVGTGKTYTTPDELILLLDALGGYGYNTYVIIDQLTQQYLYLSPNVAQLLGYPIAQIYEMGMGIFAKCIHEDDLAGAMAFIEAIMAHLYKISPEDRLRTRSNYDLRLRTGSGQLRRFLQHTTCLNLTPEGMPHIVMAMIMDITHLKPLIPATDTERPNLQLTIHAGGDDQLVMQTIGDRIITRHKSLLSKREREILALLDVGFTTKQIADKLFVSRLTVETQRRKMLQKTGVVDTTALVSYARLLGWIRP